MKIIFPGNTSRIRVADAKEKFADLVISSWVERMAHNQAPILTGDVDFKPSKYQVGVILYEDNHTMTQSEFKELTQNRLEQLIINGYKEKPPGYYD